MADHHESQEYDHLVKKNGNPLYDLPLHQEYEDPLYGMKELEVPTKAL